MRYISKYSWVRYRYNFNERSRNLLAEPWAGGVTLLIFVVIAMLLANLPWTAEAYHRILTTDISLAIQSQGETFNLTYPRDMTVEKFINDGLMMIFFFGVGLEIKREILHGQLSSFQKAILPVLAAVGGMLVPALIYWLFNDGSMTANGWGIPMATDIAFAIGILSILGDKVPVSLKIFLTALAIADDLGAIIVIAMFYGGAINWWCLGAAAILVGLIYIMNRAGERRLMYYVVPALVIWSLFYYSGVHATLSGVVMAMLIPSQPRYSKKYFLRQADHIEAKIVAAAKVEGSELDETYHEELRNMGRLSYGSIGMSHELEHILAPYVTFVIMPIFALANAGVHINPDHLNIFAIAADGGSIGCGIFFGLMLGKPIGIFLTSWLAVKLRLAAMPEGATWKMLFAVACLGGIGFTMSIFVDTLAFAKDGLEFIDAGKIAILAGSMAAALFGIVLINIFAKKKILKA